jgi:GT2 family glycosyltransferase
VVIVSWNVRDDLLRCIAALLSEDVRQDLNIEIIVVDNGSTDGTVEALEHLPVTVIATGENLGYGRANNIGLSRAHGKYLLVLNPDTVPLPASLTRLVGFAAGCKEAGIVSPQLRNDDGSLQTSVFQFPTLLMAAIDLFPLPRIVPGRVRRWLELSRLNGRYPQERESKSAFRVDHPLGACLLIKREAYFQCGGFDDNIFMYSEEIELALRYAQAGWQCWHVPAAVVVHLGGRSTRQLPERMFVELWRSRMYIYSRYYTRTSARLLRALLRVAMWTRIVWASVRPRFGMRRGESKSAIRQANVILRMMKSR